MRWLIALRLLLLPFQAPLTANAQQDSVSTTTPACEFQLNTLKPGQFCVPQTLEFKPGDSNETLEQRKRDEEIQKQREIDYVRAQAAKKRQLISSSTNTITTTSVTSSGANKLYPYSGQCVPFARAYSGIAISGTAKNVATNSRTPQVGSIVITYESWAGHAAVVTAIGDGYIHVIEGNYYRGWVSERDIPTSAGTIKGYVLPGT